MKKRKLSIEQYRGLRLHATPPAERWKDGENGANYTRTYDSLFKRCLLVWVGGDDRDDTVVPTTEGWRALRAYEAEHSRCTDCGGRAVVVADVLPPSEPETGEIPDTLLDEFTEYAIDEADLDITLDEARAGHRRATVYRELSRRAYAAGRASVR